MKERLTRKRLLLEALATCVVLEVVFFPLATIFYLYSRPISIGAVAALAAYSLVRPLISRLPAFRWIVLGLGSPFYLLCLIIQSMMIRLSWLAGKPVSIGLAAVSAAFIVSRWRWPGRAWPLTFLLIALAAFAVQLPWPVLALFLVGAAALLLAAFKGATTRLALPLMSLFAFLGLVLAHDLTFYLSPDWRAAGRIEKQPWARPLLLYGHGPRELERQLGAHLRFAIFACGDREVLLGNRTLFERGSKLLLLPLDGAQPRTIELAGTAGDNLARDCAAGRYYMPDQGVDLLEAFDAQPFARSESLKMLSGRLGLIRIAPERNLALMLSDSHKAIFPYSLDPLAPLNAAGTQRLIPVRGRNTDFVISHSRGEIIHASNAGILSFYDLETFKQLDELQLEDPAPFLANLALDDERGRLYMTRFLGGDVLMFDVASRRLLRSIKLKQGVRFVALVPQRNLLAVANYMSGELSLLDADTLATRASLRVGRRPRWIDVSDQGDRLALVSAAGAMLIELDLVPGLDAQK